MDDIAVHIHEYLTRRYNPRFARVFGTYVTNTNQGFFMWRWTEPLLCSWWRRIRDKLVEQPGYSELSAAVGLDHDMMLNFYLMLYMIRLGEVDLATQFAHENGIEWGNIAHENDDGLGIRFVPENWNDEGMDRVVDDFQFELGVGGGLVEWWGLYGEETEQDREGWGVRLIVLAVSLVFVWFLSMIDFRLSNARVAMVAFLFSFIHVFQRFQQ